MKAERVASLFWIMLAGAAVIWSFVIGLGFYGPSPKETAKFAK